MRDPLEGITGAGRIRTGARPGNVSPGFRPVLDRAIERWAARGDARCSLYVYGSVATGTARVGHSDVDLASIGLERAVADEWAAALTSEFQGLCRGVEIGAAQRTDYEGGSDEAYGNRVFLRHYCVHLAGPDPASGLPDFPADRAAARGFNGDIARCAQRWADELRTTQDAPRLGRRMARKTLFAVASLVSIADGTWTTDRVSAARRWASIHPSLQPALDTLIEWSDGAPARASHDGIARVLDGVVADVVEEFRRRIGLWAVTST